ncbi:MAG: ABC transporter substrate-binding protein [Oscillospiraceae bacterium]
MKKRLLSAVMPLTMLVTTLTACTGGGTSSSGAAGSTASAAGEAKTSLVLALQGEPTTLDPQYADDTNMNMVAWQVYDTLVRFDGDTLEIEPVLATSYEAVEDTVWEFKLREGVKFSDGTDFTAEDAAWSVNRIISTDYGSQIASDFETIEKAEAVDATTIRITTKEADPILLKRLTKLAMVSKAFTEGKSNEELTTVANGTSAYKVDEWDRGSSITLSYNENYWGEKPAITNATYRFIEESSTRVSALQSGEVDFAVNMLPEYIDMLPKVVSGRGLENYFMRFNMIDGIMTSKELRLAANYAIDKEAIATELFGGYATPEPGQIDREGNTGFTADLEAYPYDPDKARELIAAAGYNGETIEIISEKSRWLKDGEVTEAVAAMLQEVGLNVQVKFVSWNEWLDTLFDKTKTPSLQFSSTSSDYMDAGRTYNSSVLSTGTQSAVSNPVWDALIQQANYEMDAEKRQAIFDELNHALYEDPPKLLLVNVDSITGVAENLEFTFRNDCRVYLNELYFS